MSHALSCLFNSFVGDIEQVYVQCVKSALKLFCSFGMFEFLLRSTLFCFSFEYCWFSYLGVHSDCTLSIWTSPSKFKKFRPVSHCFFLLSLFKFPCIKKHNVFSPYHILYNLSFCYAMYYIVSKICIGGCFLKDCFYCYSQQIIYAIANKYLITCNLSCCNTECHPKPNQNNIKYSYIFRTKDFVPQT